jgi:hypothetical protein
MTYKQVKKAIQVLLESHAMIKEVRFATPTEWINRESKPEFPCCLYAITAGSFERGYKNFNVDFWFLDQSGKEGEFELDVVSDQTEIASDIVALLKARAREWTIDENISFTVVLEEFEDFLSGVTFSVTIKTYNKYDTCAIPVN